MSTLAKGSVFEVSIGHADSELFNSELRSNHLYSLLGPNLTYRSPEKLTYTRLI